MTPLPAVLLFLALLIAANAQAQNYPPPCLQNQFGSCGSVYDSDGNYRGELSGNRFDPNSISNPYGRYGNPYSQDSINNPYGAGNPYIFRAPRQQRAE